MGTRLLKRNEKSKGEHTSSSKQEAIPSRFLRKVQQIKESPREKYLKEIEVKIYNKERELESITIAYQIAHETHEVKLREEMASIRQQVVEEEAILIGKRQERLSLESPLNERKAVLDEREKNLDIRSNQLDNETQAIFERERATESKLEAIQDLADTLGETRIRLAIKEKGLSQKESVLKTRENTYLLATTNFIEEKRKWEVEKENKEREVELKELNVQSKEENLVNREEALIQEKLLVQSQRQALMAAKHDSITKKGR